MNSIKFNEIISILRSITLEKQSQNIYESNMVNGLKYENNLKNYKFSKSRKGHGM